VSAIKSHSDVVRPFASGQQLSLSLNPYHLGFSLWEHIIDKFGMEKAREVCRDEDDFGFIRNYLDQELAEKLDLFVYEARKDGETKIANRDIHAIREAILAPKFNYGAPCIAISQVSPDGSLNLHHDYLRDGRGLELPQAEKVMDYVARVWRRPAGGCTTPALFLAIVQWAGSVITEQSARVSPHQCGH
jgi:stage V sporulation protein R